jgi:hypothetical protein
MTATNHAVTGAVLGLALGNPLIALPIAFVSHYALDILPHFGNSDNPNFIKSKFFRNFLILDASVCVLLVLALGVVKPEHWVLASICAFVATSPDLALIPRFIAAKQNKPYTPGAYNRFATAIQRYEKPEGALVEFAWLCMAIALLLGFM